MQFQLPKTDKEYIEEIYSKWGIEINKDHIIGIFKISRDRKWGYFDKCCTVDNKKLFVPGVKKQLQVNIIGNSKENLTEGREYSFKVNFDKLSKRIQIRPFLFITHLHSVKTLLTPEEEKSINLKRVIRNIYKEKLQQNNPFNIVDMAEAVDSLATDIYSENKRFIYELIQNADDSSLNENAELYIEIKGDYVIVSHNGKPFDERDLRGLCGIGRGTKQNDASKTGYKGIGFKSVFGQKDGVVYVKTGDLLFKFDRDQAIQQGWNSKWGKQEEWEYKHQLKFKSPWQLIPLHTDSVGEGEVDYSLSNKNFSVKTVIKVENPTELENDINQLFEDARFILFLRKINTIKLRTSKGEISVQKQYSKGSSVILTLKRNEKFLSKWYVKTRVHEVPNNIKRELNGDAKSPKKLQNITHTELSFALKMNKEGNKIEKLDFNESTIYTYLPTSVKEYRLSFLVNSNFLVDAGREKLHKDRIWNKWLFSVIGYELVVCCSELALNAELKTSFLKIFIKDYFEESDQLRKWFNEGVKKGIEEIALIENKKNELSLVKDIILDESGIIEQDFVTSKDLAEFISGSNELGLINRENIVSKFSGSKKLVNFGLKVFDEKLLKEFFQSSLFREKLNHNLIFELIKFLKTKDKNDSIGEWNYIIRNTAFILSSEGCLEKIPLVCFPVSEFSTDFGSENTLIDDKLFQKIQSDKEIHDWLVELGVTEPSEVSFLEKEIIGKVDEVVNANNWLDIAEFIMKLHKNEKLNNGHYSQLQELRLKTDEGFNEAKLCYLHADYQPKIDFSKYLNNLAVISKDYMGRYDAFEWKSLFIKINVSDDINFMRFFKISGNEFDLEYKEVAVENVKNLGHAYSHLLRGGSFSISYFSFFKETLNYKYSKVFWNRLIEKFTLTFFCNTEVRGSHSKEKMQVKEYKLDGERYILADQMPWGYYGSSVYVTPFIPYFLKIKKEKCIPTLLGENVIAEEAFSNTQENIEIAGNYLPIIDVEKTLSKDWIEFLGIKHELKIEDFLNILNQINSDLYKQKVKKDNVKRLGLIYNQLAQAIPNLSIQEENNIKNWANQNLIICKDNIPRRNDDIYWLRIEGFEDSVDKIPSLLIPPNVIINDNVEKLYELFGIKFVDQCDYLPENKNEDINLKLKVLELVPAVCLLLKSRLRIAKPDQFLFETYDHLKEFIFYNCSEISLILNYKEQKIKGAKVNYYLDENSFFFTTNWRHPIERYNISKYITSIIKAKGLNQEIQLLLELNSFQINQYLSSQGLNISNIEELTGYKEIIKLITSIGEKQQQEKIENIVTPQQEEVNEKSHIISEIEVEKFTTTEKGLVYNEEEIEQLRELFGRELEQSELEQENIFAQIKALRFFKDKGYDTKKAELNFEKTYSKKFLDPILDKSGNEIKVLCRSARGGILFFGGYAWENLSNENTILYLLTGDKSTDCFIINSTEELENQFPTFFKVIRRTNTEFLDVKNLIESENEVSELQLLYKVKDGVFDIIFNPQQNEPGETEGGLIDDDI